MALTKALVLASNSKASIPNKNNLFSVTGGVQSARTGEGFLNAYASIGWWHAVNFMIALELSGVKWTLFDVSTRDKPKQIYKHRILDVLHGANPFQTSNEIMALDSIYMEGVGESFWALNFNNLNEPAEIILPYPQKMSVVPDKNFPFVKGYVYGTGAEAVPFTINEIIHFKYPNPLNQYRGLGQAQAIGINLDAEENTDRWVNQFFYNSARPDGVIQFDYNLADEQFDKLNKQWNEKYRGISKAHSVALLEGGGKYIQIQNSIKDMDFPNLKEKNRDVIFGVMGMPIGMMGISKDVNKANLEGADYQFERHLIKTRLDWKVSKLNEQFVPKFKGTQNLILGYEEVVTETVEQKMNLADTGVRGTLLTIDEARKKRGENPLGGKLGECLIVPVNMNLVTKDGEVVYQSQSNQYDIARGGQQLEPVKSKGFSPEQKKEIWNRYALKTQREEDVFKRKFSQVWNEQKNLLVSEFEKTGKLPELKDEDTAKQFEPVIELVYHDSFESAIKSYKGGEGSGNFGHEGRPGEVGGSGLGGGSSGGKPSGNKPNNDSEKLSSLIDNSDNLRDEIAANYTDSKFAAKVLKDYNVAGSAKATAIQLAASEVGFEGDISHFISPEEANNLLQCNKDEYHSVVQEMYNNTQNYLSEQSITNITAYRGINFSRNELPEEFKGMKVGETKLCKINTQPLSSFSIKEVFAESYADALNGGSGYIIKANISSKSIFSVGGITGIGAPYVNEVVITNFNNEVEVTRWQ